MIVYPSPLNSDLCHLLPCFATSYSAQNVSSHRRRRRQSHEMLASASIIPPSNRPRTAPIP